MMHNNMNDDKPQKKDKPFISMDLGGFIGLVIAAILVILLVLSFVRHQPDDPYSNNDPCVAQADNC